MHLGRTFSKCTSIVLSMTPPRKAHFVLAFAASFPGIHEKLSCCSVLVKNSHTRKQDQLLQCDCRCAVLLIQGEKGRKELFFFKLRGSQALRGHDGI